MTTAAQAREQTQSPRPKQPAKRSPAVAALLALIPGLGHFYVRERLRGIILIFLLPLMVVLTLWRLEVSGVDLGALLNGTQSTADFTTTATSHFSMAVVLFVMLVLIYLWSIWDAYSSAGGRLLPSRLPFFMLFLVAFIIGWDVTQINLYKAITEIGDIVPRLSQLAWPGSGVRRWRDQHRVAGAVGHALHQRLTEPAGRDRRAALHPHRANLRRDFRSGTA